MARKKKVVPGTKQINPEDRKRVITVPSSGEKITIHGIPPMRTLKLSKAIRKQFKQDGEPTEPPTYSVTVGTGSDAVEQVHEHDHVVEMQPNPDYDPKLAEAAQAEDAEPYKVPEEIEVVVSSTLQTDEDKTAWEEHQEAVTALGREIGLRTMMMTLRKGLRVYPRKDKEWWEEAEHDGLTSGNKLELMETYIVDKVCPTTEDQTFVTQEIIVLSQPDQTLEAQEAVRDLFRGEDDS